MFNSRINIDPIKYVENKNTNITINDKTDPVSKVVKEDNKLIVETRRFSARDRSELSSMKEEVTLQELNDERDEVLNYLEKLDILIADMNEIDEDINK